MNSADPKVVFAALEASLSADRLSKYMGLAKDNPEKALALYEHNTRLSESFYTPLQGLEICIRNAIDRELSSNFGASWYDTKAVPIFHPQSEMITKAKASLSGDGKAVTPGRMVAELNFGFWVGVLGPAYETRLWRPCLRMAFPGRPKQQERKQVQGALNSIRRLRNRVAHHEPILHRNLQSDHALILKIISWVCPHTAIWVGTNSRFPAVFSN